MLALTDGWAQDNSKYLFLADNPVRPGKYVLTILVQTLPWSETARSSSSSCILISTQVSAHIGGMPTASEDHVVRSMAGLRVSVQRFAHSSDHIP